jgi:hypothetical protein
MIRVLEVLPGGELRVDGRGLYRVRRKETSEIVAELLDAPTAARLVDFMGQPEWGEPSIAIPYEALCSPSI